MNIFFDETDTDSISKAILKLNKIRLSLCKNDINSKQQNARYNKRLASIEKEFNTINNIYSTNISKLYDTKDVRNSFYVYAHCDPLSSLNIKDNPRHLFAASVLGLNFPPFYIGKGIGDRCDDLNRNEGHRKIRKLINNQNREIISIKLIENLNEGEALSIESKLIDIFGLKVLSNFGMLVNLDEGKSSKLLRDIYPKGVPWYLNKMKLQVYENNCSLRNSV